MSTFSVLMETTYRGDPSTWPEGADEPKVLASGLSWTDACSVAEKAREAYDDRDYCDRCVDDGEGILCLGGCGYPEHNIYLEEEADDAFLKRARAM